MKAGVWREYDVDKTKVEQLRAKIFDYCKQHPEQVDIEDVKSRIHSPEDLANNNVDRNNNQTTDWMLKRFLISSHKEVDGALQKFIEFFSFRKAHQMAQIKLENVLASEFFLLHPFVSDGLDKERNRIFVVREKYYKKIPQFEVFIKRAVLYLMEQIDLEYERGECDGVCIVLDAQGFSVNQLDLDLLQFLIKTVPLGYAGLVRCVLLYETPMLLTYLFKVVEGWMPSLIDKNGNKRKLFHAIDKKTIKDFIDDDQRPEFLNGLRKLSNVVPPTTRPFAEMVYHTPGIDPQNIKKIQEFLDQKIREL